MGWDAYRTGKGKRGKDRGIFGGMNYNKTLNGIKGCGGRGLWWEEREGTEGYFGALTRTVKGVGDQQICLDRATMP